MPTEKKTETGKARGGQGIQTIRDFLQEKETAPTKSGAVVSVHERTEKQREINLVINSYRETPIDQGQERERLAGEIARLMHEIEASGGDGHSTPEWLIPTLKGNIANTFHKYDEAIDHHSKALRHAKKTSQRGISHVNISNSLRESGRYDAAVEHSMSAVELDPRCEPFWAYGVMSLFKAGRFEEVREIMRHVLKSSDFTQAGNPWVVYITSYREFQEMKSIIKEVDEIFRIIESVDGGEEQ